MSKMIKALFAVLGLSMMASSYAEPVNINAATADQIAASLNGVGSKQATAIVEYRETNGPFQSLDDITKVKGVGVKTVAKNQDNILFDGAATTTTGKPGTELQRQQPGGNCPRSSRAKDIAESDVAFE